MDENNIFLIITTLLHSPDLHSKRLGELLRGIKEGLETGKLTQSEFAELMIDVEALKKTIENTHDIIFNRQLHDAVCVMIELAKMAKI